MLTIGDRFPTFTATAVVSNDIDTAFQEVTNQSAQGKWQVYFFYPKDFTFICPTEIAQFNSLNSKFQEHNAQLYGASTDSDFVHLAWRRSHPDLMNLSFPLISDIRRDLSIALGVLDRHAGVCTRATFIVDPEGVIRYAAANDLSVGRNPEEILRTLVALQTGELCACNWNPGDKFVDVA
jgi:lipoyl-dependent peroxiredoxin subunit C